MLAAPDKSEYTPFVPTVEQAQFILNFYSIDHNAEKRAYRRAVYSRPKGSGKSPLLAALACAEALAPVVFDGWDANGQPVGKPWNEVRTPLVQLAAVAEDQTQNSWGPLLEMLREGNVVDEYPGVEPMESFVNLPAGKIQYVTSAANSREGARPIFCVLDQTEAWVPSNGGVKLAETTRRNLGKVGGSSIESPNAFAPGEESVAEKSAQAYSLQIEGKLRTGGILYDHREWPPETDMTDRASLYAGLLYAYGDSAVENGGWVDIDRIIAEVWDPSTDPQDARRYYGNQITHTSDAWVSQPEWAACTQALEPVADKDDIALGFDGSRHRSEGVTDATALVGCRLRDGHMFLVRSWEQPDNDRNWWVPTSEVNAEVREAFSRWNVKAFYCDPAADWRSYVAQWEAEFGHKLTVKANQQHPCEWWMGGTNLTKTVRATDQMHAAILHQECSHDGGATLTRHVLNARRRQTRVGYQIAKDYPDSPRKIDAAVAAILAWQARLDSVAAGLGPVSNRRSNKLMRF